MKHSNATPQQRFLAYFIDYLIIGFGSEIILSIIYAIMKLDVSLLETKYKYFLDKLYQGFIDVEALKQILILCFLIIGLTTLVTVILAFIYFCIIPLFWDKQTIGRLAASVKVVNMKNEGKVGFGWLFLREIVGGCLLTDLFGSSLVIPLVLTIVFSVNKGRSLADMIGKTRLISLKSMTTPVVEFSSGVNNSSSEDYVEETKKEEEDEYLVI